MSETPKRPKKLLYLDSGIARRNNARKKLEELIQKHGSIERIPLFKTKHFTIKEETGDVHVREPVFFTSKEQRQKFRGAVLKKKGNKEQIFELFKEIGITATDLKKEGSNYDKFVFKIADSKLPNKTKIRLIKYIIWHDPTLKNKTRAEEIWEKRLGIPILHRRA